MTQNPTIDRARSDAIKRMLMETVAEARPRRSGIAKRATVLISLAVTAALLATGGAALALGAGPFFFSAPPPVLPTRTHSIPPNPTPTPSPTPTPTVTQAPQIDLSSPSTWTIGFDAIGPATLGGSISAESGLMTAYTKSTQPYCPVVFFDSPTSGDIWLLPGSAAAPDRTTLILLTANGHPTQSLYAASPKTAKGIGLGSTLGELQDAYPGVAKTEFAPGDSTFPAYAITENGSSWIVFEVDPDSGQVQDIFVGSTAHAQSEVCG